jgi:hypothetical protein
MKIHQYVRQLTLAALVSLPCIVNAAVSYPALGIANIGSDAGATLSATSFSIEATAFQIVTNGPNIDIADNNFTLMTDPCIGTCWNGTTGAFDGSFTVGDDLLSGTFTGLALYDDFSGGVAFTGDVVYTGGSLMGSLSGGRLEGVLAGSSVQATLGAVVPIPAAAWLFGSGLVGLIAVARRKVG